MSAVRNGDAKGSWKFWQMDEVFRFAILHCLWTNFIKSHPFPKKLSFNPKSVLWNSEKCMTNWQSLSAVTILKVYEISSFCQNTPLLIQKTHLEIFFHALYSILYPVKFSMEWYIIVEVFILIRTEKVFYKNRDSSMFV